MVGHIKMCCCYKGRAEFLVKLAATRGYPGPFNRNKINTNFREHFNDLTNNFIFISSFMLSLMLFLFLKNLHHMICQYKYMLI